MLNLIILKIDLDLAAGQTIRYETVFLFVNADTHVLTYN